MTCTFLVNTVDSKEYAHKTPKLSSKSWNRAIKLGIMGTVIDNQLKYQEAEKMQ